METVKIGALICEVVRSDRRTVGMRASTDGVVQILAPRRVSLAKLEKICASYEKKLLQMRDKQQILGAQREKFMLSYGSHIRFFGKKLEVRPCFDEGIGYDGNAMYIESNLTEEGVKSAVIAAYKKAAAEYIVPRVGQISENMGLSPVRVRINSAKTHFASCSKKSSLNFSWHCMMVSREAVDYVIVHELCHIMHFDHSPRFWEKVEKHCPEYKKHKAELKALSKGLASENWD